MGTVSYSTPSSWDLKQSTQRCQGLLMDSPLFWILNRWRKYFQFVIQTLYLYSTPLNYRWKIICRMVWLKLRGQGFPTKCHKSTQPKTSPGWPFIQHELCLWWTSRDLTWRQTRRRTSRSTRSTTRDKSIHMGRASLPGMKRSLGAWWPRNMGNCPTLKGLTFIA